MLEHRIPITSVLLSLDFGKFSRLFSPVGPELPHARSVGRAGRADRLCCAWCLLPTRVFAVRAHALRALDPTQPFGARAPPESKLPRVGSYPGAALGGRLQFAYSAVEKSLAALMKPLLTAFLALCALSLETFVVIFRGYKQRGCSGPTGGAILLGRIWVW